MTADAQIRGQLSWQQEYSLRWEADYGDNEVLYDSFAVPWATDAASVRHHLERIAHEADVLRMVRADLRTGAVYSDRLKARGTTRRCASTAEAGRAVRDHHTAGLQPDEPRWSYEVIEHPGDDGHPRFTLSVKFDHLLADARA